MSPLIAVPVRPEDRDACAATDVLRRVGDKWSLLIMALLADRSYGFGELDRAVPGLSRRILTLTLRGLVHDGLVTRAEQGAAGARVDYALSDLGRSLLPLAVAIGQWAEEHGPTIAAARQQTIGPRIKDPGPDVTWLPQAIRMRK